MSAPVLDLDAFAASMLAMAQEIKEHTSAPVGLIDAALARQDARPARRIDYDRMRRTFPKQKAALNRAVKTRDPEKVAAACKAAVTEWDEVGAWPDDWSRWQRALDDVLPWHRQVDIKDL